MNGLDDIISRMSLEEKASLCVGAGPWQTTAFEHLGLESLEVSDGPHGLRRPQDFSQIAALSWPATCFPTASSVASSWDVENARKMGIAMAEEAKSMGTELILGPGTNIKRSPACGRNFEYYSEDPHVSGEFSVAFIEGVQSQGVGTSLKHFAANNQEHKRFSTSSEVDERTLREIYLPAFEAAVKRAQPWTLMAAYNKINGIYATEHFEFLTKILRDEWGFEGFVVSDWGAVNDRSAALEAGLDLEMPGPKPRSVQRIIDTIKDGSLELSVLDKAVERILKVVQKAKLTPKKTNSFDIEAHHELAKNIAADGMVLLKNNDVLPLRSPKKIAVIGRSAMHAHFQGGGSSFINTTKVDSPLESIKALAGDAEVLYSEGYPAGLAVDAAMIVDAAKVAKDSDVVILFVALPSQIESEGYDRTHLSLTPQQIELIQAVGRVQPKTVVILNNGSAVTMSEWIDDAGAVLEAWMMGQAGARAIADILFGKTNPSGKLAETFPLHLKDTPAFLSFPGENSTVRYGEGLFVGYRYYDAKEVPVLFPFGYGLSYTTFKYSNLICGDILSERGDFQISFEVTNSGTLEGKEVVQVYVGDIESRLLRPHKELKGFAKVSLKPGETKTVSFSLDSRAFSYWDPAHGNWVAEAGDFEILVGASSQDIRLKKTIQLKRENPLPCILTSQSTIKEWMDDPRGKGAVEPILVDIVGKMGAHATDDSVMGISMMQFFQDFPASRLFEFLEGMFPKSAEEMTQEIMSQIS